MKFKLTIKGQGMAFDREIDEGTLAQVMALLLGGNAPPPAAQQSTAGGSPRRKSKAKTQSKVSPSTSGGAKPKRRAAAPSLVKDLSLRPKGKKSWVDFVEEKQPKTHQEKQTVAVFWLRHEAGLDSGITIDHINTCYQGARWSRPSDLVNAVSVTSKKSGWLDTSDKADIRLTVQGEDHVEHDLPSKAKKE